MTRTNLAFILRRGGLSLGLLLDRGGVVLVATDVVLLLLVLLVSSVEGGSTYALYMCVILPELLLGIPLLAGLIDVERRAGCLELVFTSPSADHYFDIRAGALALIIIAQGLCVLTVGWLFITRFAFLPAVCQLITSTSFVVAVSLFWCTRCRARATVAGASLFSVVVAAPLLIRNPIRSDWTSEGIRGFIVSNLFLVGLCLAGYFAARRRLQQPAALIM